jgi:hypothetical protein
MAIDPTFSLFTPTLLVVSGLFPLLATIVVGLRFYVKRIKRQEFYLDDWTVICSLLLCWGLSANLWVFAPKIGVTRIKLPPLEATLQTFKFFWINSIPFSLVLGLVKISILLFYQRVFSVTPFKRASWVLVVMIAMWTVAIILVSIFKTNPISGIWTDPTTTYVIDDAAYAIAVASMSLGFDVIILLMPLFVIRTLHMPTRRKIAVLMVFWLGALCCVAAAARLHLLYKAIYTVTDNPNAYANLTTAFVWAELEPNASVIAASLPMLRPLFSSDEKGLGTWFSTKFGSMFSRRSSNKASYGGSDPSKGSSGSRFGYVKADSVTESTRELNKRGRDDDRINVRHDIELGYQNTSYTK